MTVEEIKNEITNLSGSGRRVVPTRRHGIYSSFTLDGLDDMIAVRDTKRRFYEFGIPDDLTGKTFLDLGCNVGAMSFEAARRGAIVTGVEYREDRVYLCNVIASKWNLDAKFYQADFNGKDPNGVVYFPTEDMNKWCKPHDIVMCCSVDEYINDLESFYAMLRDLCSDQLYFECNVQHGQNIEDTIAILERAGFPIVTYLGSGHSGGISRKRKIYRAKVARISLGIVDETGNIKKIEQ